MKLQLNRKPPAAVVLLAALALVSPVHADLTGHWHVELTFDAPVPSFVELVQTGNTISIPTSAFVQGNFDPPSFDATIVGDKLSIGGAPFQFYFDGRTLVGENVIDGLFVTSYPPQLAFKRFLATRCECFDGNEADGDGCDARCRIEPCYECAGDPSICAPAADGTACNDRRDCSTGTTCSSGSCAGGTEVPTCTDMTGHWRIISDDVMHQVEDIREVEQRDGLLRFRELDGSLAEIGTIDPLANTIELVSGYVDGRVGWAYGFADNNSHAPSCSPVTFSGALSADGQTFSGSGHGTAHSLVPVSTVVIPGCLPSHAFTQTGYRCSPGDCLTAADQCPPCQRRSESGACEPGPRQGCLHSIDPQQSSIFVADRRWDENDRFRWKWRAGMALDARLLGNPISGTGMQICLFDESSGPSQLIFSSYFDPESYYDGEVSEDGLTFRRATGRRPEIVSWQPAPEGESSMLVSVRAGGVDFEESDWRYTVAIPLARAPFGLPLRVQGQIDRDGVCFESLFDSSGTTQNRSGRFTARASE